jgi:hypothetical protein
MRNIPPLYFPGELKPRLDERVYDSLAGQDEIRRHGIGMRLKFKFFDWPRNNRTISAEKPPGFEEAVLTNPR